MAGEQRQRAREQERDAGCEHELTDNEAAALLAAAEELGHRERRRVAALEGDRLVDDGLGDEEVERDDDSGSGEACE
jgi:hypothetical protein